MKRREMTIGPCTTQTFIYTHFVSVSVSLKLLQTVLVGISLLHHRQRKWELSRVEVGSLDGKYVL